MKKSMVVFHTESSTFTIYPYEYWTDVLIPSYREALLASGRNQEEVDKWDDERVVDTLWDHEFVFGKGDLEQIDFVAYDFADGSLMTFNKANWARMLEEITADEPDWVDWSDEEIIESYYGEEFVWQEIEK